MKISSISLQNFKSYREFQKITFGIGDQYITIIEGQMGHGKSNLLNGFYWCLFGQYWDSDKSSLIDDPNPNEVDLFNKAELSENREDGSKVSLFVEIEFYDDDQSKYTLKRSQSGTFIRKEWKFEKSSTILLNKIDSSTGEFSEYSSDAAMGQLQKFFPRSLSNYFLFRGENRAQLVKIQGKDEFQQAIKELSKIEVFTRGESHLASVMDELRSELAAQASESIKAEMEAILVKKKSAELALADFEEQIQKLSIIEQKKKNDYEFFRDKIKENQAAFELKVKIEREEKEIGLIQKEVSAFHDTKQKELTRKWAALGAVSLIENTKKKYENAVNSGNYPPDISRSLVDKILDDLTCICGTEFKENDEIYNKIQKLKDIESIDTGLLHQIEKLMHEIERASDLIKEYPNKIREIDSEVKDRLAEIKSKQLIIAGYKSKIGNIDFSLEDLQKKQDDANEEYIKTREKIKELKGWAEEKRKDISTLETEFGKLEARLDKSNLPAIRAELAERALKALRELKKLFENSIYDDLEKFTQENWEILVYDKLYYQRIELDRNSMYFEVFDRDDSPCRAILNTGHSILLVLSFISGLIRIAKEVWEEDFPLVLDAPLSEIGDTALPKALIGFGKIFNQTIVILKDGTVNASIYKDIQNKVGKRYWIEFDSNKQHSKISLINS